MSLKTLLPLRTRIRLKRLGAGVLDALAPRSGHRIPPRRLTTIGSGDFEVIGEAFARRLISEGLRPDGAVLDIGSGQGRMARPLVGYLTQGRYEGFDIDRAAVEWCQGAYRDAPRFRFTHANVYNALYNPSGETGPYRFPFADNIFDAALATSVFTHMREPDVAHYLGETARVLEPDGFALVTVFLKRDGPGTLGFAHELGEHSWTTVPDLPEAAIALEEAWFAGVAERAGLRITSLRRGSCWGGERGSVQDIVVLRAKI